MSKTVRLVPGTPPDSPASTAAELLFGASAQSKRQSKKYPSSRGGIAAHEAVEKGIPGSALTHLLSQVAVLEPAAVYKAVGVSLRTAQRRNLKPQQALSIEQGGRAWKFAEILAKAAQVFGDQAAGERWLATAAPSLDQRKPIDMLTTPVGTGMVEQLLGRIERGVYT